MAANSGGTIELVGLVKRYDPASPPALDGIDLEVRAGEFFSLLGPSGCGKTTTLRLIGGFEQPTAGRVVLDGIDLAPVPPHRRPVNTVFQSYALFPHLSVEDNVAYGLRRRGGTTKAELRQRVGRALELVRLAGYEHRRPAQLSGGQQQRVALARALVLEPAVLLLDEPLGALDAKLRKALQIELTNLQREVGVTFVYVTHDQEEALTMSDRLAVMDRGRIVQHGVPRQVYEEPASAWVADFLGVANLLDVTCFGPVPLGGTEIRLGAFGLRACGGAVGLTGPAKVVIRPERVRLAPYAVGGENHLPALVDRVVYVGPTTQVVVRLPQGDTVQVLVTNTGEATTWEPGAGVTVVLPPEALRVLPVGADSAAERVVDLKAAEDAERTPAASR